MSASPPSGSGHCSADRAAGRAGRSTIDGVQGDVDNCGVVATSPLKSSTASCPRTAGGRESSAASTGVSPLASPRPPWLSKPKGFLLVVVEDAEEGSRALTALREAGFDDGALTFCTAAQVLRDYQRYTAERSLPRRILRVRAGDRAGTELYLAFARDGRSALWVRAPDIDDANRAVRCLVGFRSLYFRHYGRWRDREILIRSPSS